jgi:hypothetical protein
MQHTELEHGGFTMVSQTPEAELRRQLEQPDPQPKEGTPPPAISSPGAGAEPQRSTADPQPAGDPKRTETAAPADEKPDKRTPEGRVAILRSEINQLTREKHTVNAETARGRTELEELNARIAEARREHDRLSRDIAAGRVDPKAPTDDKPAAAAPARAPEPQEDDFEDFREWVKAHAAWAREQAKLDAQELIEAQQRQAAETEKQRTEREQTTQREAQQRDVQQKHIERVQAYLTEHPEFAEIMEKAGDLPTNPAIDAHIMHSKYGPRLMRYLAENPEESERLSALGWGPTLVEIGVIEAGFRQADTSLTAPTGAKSGSPEAPVSRTQARPPINPVGGGAPVADAGDEDLSNMEFGPRYVELMNERDRKTAQRRL